MDTYTCPHMLTNRLADVQVHPLRGTVLWGGMFVEEHRYIDVVCVRACNGGTVQSELLSVCMLVNMLCMCVCECMHCICVHVCVQAHVSLYACACTAYVYMCTYASPMASVLMYFLEHMWNVYWTFLLFGSSVFSCYLVISVQCVYVAINVI